MSTGSAGTRGPTRRAAAGLAAACLLLPSMLAAQPVPGDDLTLTAALEAAFAGNRALAIRERGLDAARGALVGARGAFDLRLHSTLSEAQSESNFIDGEGGIAADAVTSRRSSYELGLQRELRSGLVLRPGVTLARTDDPLLAPAPYAQAGASLSVVVPLAYNRGGTVTRSGERVAILEEESSRHLLDQAVAETAHEVVSAYWSYLAAQRRLEVQRSSEERAERLLEETRTLIRANERPRSDLNQVSANVASKRMTRIVAEHEITRARQRLGLLMGLDASSSARMGAPGESFPRRAAFSSEAALPGLLSQAEARRPELAVARLRWSSSRVLHETARSASRPRLDLALSLGYVGMAARGDLGAMITPLYRDIPGPNASVQLSYQGAVANRRGRGDELRERAGAEQARIAVEDAAARVEAGVTLAAAALEQSLLLLREAEGAVELYEAAVGNERRRHELGFATLIDVILAEDNLTAAQLAAVDAELGHALALCDLRYETGTLTPAGPRGAAVAAAARNRP